MAKYSYKYHILKRGNTVFLSDFDKAVMPSRFIDNEEKEIADKGT